MKNTFIKVILFLILVAVIVIIFLLLRCPCPKQYAGYPHVRVDSTELVVWRNPDSSKTAFKNWLADFKIKYGAISDSFYCASCDSDLLLLKGKGPETLIQGLTATGGSTPTCSTCKPSGEDGPAFYSLNFPVSFDDPIQRDSARINFNGNISQNPNKPDSQRFYLLNPSNFSSTGSLIQAEYQYANEPVVVAVIDTGVDTTGIASFIYNDADAAKATSPSCLGKNADKGWNFVNGDQKYLDDYPTQHGTDVAKLIINQAVKYQNNPIKILPVKVFDSTGHTDLFHILCALAYAKDRGAKIVNASFGYYAPKLQPGTNIPDASAVLFQAYIAKYLTNANILMFCAAGNQNDSIENLVYNSPIPGDMRNLDNVSFYPATFAGYKTMPNIITVTTINAAGTVSPQQNYSPNIVDIGMLADDIINWTFIKPDKHPNTIIGSSFATPLAAGKIAANYYLINSLITVPYTKDDIWNKLGSALIQNAAAASQIKDKRSMMRQIR